MCGIMGFVGDGPALPVILEGLQRLEYRGYDSAGIALLENGDIRFRKAPGSLENLVRALEGESFEGHIGLGHTRWATHGEPDERNAHPHLDCGSRYVLVHNGIIENYAALRRMLLDQGHRFRSETDTEVIVHLIEQGGKDGDLPAFRRALEQIRGSYAIALISAADPERIYAARRDASPLVIGVGDHGGYVASDVPALLPYTRDVIYLRNDEIAVIGAGGVRIETHDGREVRRPTSRVDWDLEQAEKGGYPHFMLKEIHEQPATLAETLRGRCDPGAAPGAIREMGIPEEVIRKASRAVILACGTAYHASLVAAQAMEDLARLPARAEMASEFRYRRPVVDGDTLVLAVSQSGETADTIAAVREARDLGAKVLAVTNVVGSSLTREADGVFYMRAGPEISVAASKTYTSQLASGILVSLYLGLVRKTLPGARAAEVFDSLRAMPDAILRSFRLDGKIRECADRYKGARSFLYIGRGYNFPTACEGALKLKEISYIHAEGYSAGEMKHGPIALVEEGFPTVAIAVEGVVHEKMLSNMMEIKARGGILIAIANEGDRESISSADFIFPVPVVDEVVSPILAIVPLQLLAYHCAVLRHPGHDVDRPRNLAKSVTVE